MATAANLKGEVIWRGRCAHARNGVAARLGLPALATYAHFPLFQQRKRSRILCEQPMKSKYKQPYAGREALSALYEYRRWRRSASNEK